MSNISNNNNAIYYFTKDHTSIYMFFLIHKNNGYHKRIELSCPYDKIIPRSGCRHNIIGKDSLCLTQLVGANTRLGPVLG